MKSKQLLIATAVFAVVLSLAAVCGASLELQALSPEQLTALGLAGAAFGTINAKAGEKIAVVGTVDPQPVANSEKFTDVVDMSKFHQVLGIAMYGNMANEAITFRAVICDSGGNNAASLKAPTALTASATANDDKQQVISVRAEEVADAANGNASLHYCKFGLVTDNTTGGNAAVIALGVDLRNTPAADVDLASVVEIKL